MASASLPTHAPARKRTSPSSQRVYETWQHECRTAGEWGAYARTAARYHKPSGVPYSDEWARKHCKRWEAEQQARDAAEAAPIDDTLAYTPPPGGYPQPQPAPVLRQSDDANSPTSTLKAPTIGVDLPIVDHDITAAANGEAPNSQPANPANFQPFELEETGGGEDANPEPSQPAGELLEERPRLNTPPVRVIVRVPEERQAAGLVGWLATNPMLGPVPVWALLLLAFGALLVQLGLLG